MLPLLQRWLFAAFALLCLLWAFYGFRAVIRKIRRGRPAVESRFDRPWQRIWSALAATFGQSRVFRRRRWVSWLHALIFYGFTFYLLVNLVDLLHGYFRFRIPSENPLGAAYHLLADLASLAVYLGVIALVIRRFGRWGKDFRFGERTPVRVGAPARIAADSLIVSVFILVHVGFRMLGQGALLLGGGDPTQPLASLLAGLERLLGAKLADEPLLWQIGFWGSLGSVLLFLGYFPRSKHLHLFAAPVNYATARREGSGVLPPMQLEGLAPGEEEHLGAATLEELGWPRLLDAYACIQCNRCQEVCPASETGKALSPAALEINKRLELNAQPAFAQGAPGRPLLEFALSEEALWACTTCGACVQVCPVGDEQMFDLIDLRRHQVLVEGAFPKQLQTAFRGMERHGNPWGMSRGARMAWAEGLDVPTVAERPHPEVLYWVGCAGAYDPAAQQVARSLVQLFQVAGVDFAVLGEQERCTGDSARRAGNEELYLQLARENIETLREVGPTKIVTACPHCRNALGSEYRQLGGNFEVVHHSSFLAELLREGRLPLAQAAVSEPPLTYHDPCYLGRHGGVFAAPREVLAAAGRPLLEASRSGPDSFCCGAGGAQFFKEEAPGELRVSEARLAQLQAALEQVPGKKTVAVACPFCKSMLGSSTSAGDGQVELRDIAELLAQRVLPARPSPSDGSGP